MATSAAMSVDAGYSGTPLPKKLGLSPGLRTAFTALPDDLAGLPEAGGLDDVLEVSAAEALRGRGPFDYLHAFHTDAALMGEALPVLKTELKPAGMIWVSWPKKAAKVPTDITEDVVRDRALAVGLVDVKVCAVTEVWSGLKLVIPVAARPTAR